jgi:hypothetical protein
MNVVADAVLLAAAVAAPAVHAHALVTLPERNPGVTLPTVGRSTFGKSR